MLVKPLWSLYEPLPHPLMGVADQFRELGEGADVLIRLTYQVEYF